MGEESKGNTRRKYDREFKMEALRLVEEGNRSISQIAENLGINKDLL